jgi:hypothetical protein
MSLVGYTPSAGEAALSDAMDGYWSRLAATGDPNGAGAVAWPRYDAGTDPVLLLDDTQQPGAGRPHRPVRLLGRAARPLVQLQCSRGWRFPSVNRALASP